jgi:outer membrane receptor for ferrienterochelin and colicins
MRKFYLPALLLLVAPDLFSQEDSSKPKDLQEVVVTGQYRPQSVKNSVYQVRVINAQRIAVSGATNVQQVLHDQLGFRFTNDNTLGTSDVQLLGMSGRNVKILLDGVPMVDRGDTRESLNQVDINTIDRIEIVEGPLSVSYGSDALAGVINIITKKNTKDNLSVTARVQEETAGDEYYPFSYKGVHMQSLGIGWTRKQWGITGGLSHQEAAGWGGDEFGRGKTWKPKEQWFANFKVGFSNDVFSIYYRLDALGEEIRNRQPINTSTYKAIDKYYTTDRFTHQLQGQWRFNNRAQLNAMLAYTDYERATKTVRHDFENNTEQLTNGEGEQDISGFTGLVFRPTFSYHLSEKISIQPGIDVNYEKASGERMAGSPTITDAAFFISSEFKPNSRINIRPGLRMIWNSVYDAPPVVPSLNTKLILNKNLDLRLSYAYGFRSPALRELYFYFHDANHDINGNPDLKAENSNSFLGALSWNVLRKEPVSLQMVFTGFYNAFRNQIDLAQGQDNAGNLVYSYFNVNRSQTAGASWENKLQLKNIEASLGVSVTGYSSSQYDNKAYIKTDDREFLWVPELHSGINYHLTCWKTRIAFYYKFSGPRPSFQFGTDTQGRDIIYTAKTEAFHLADLSATTTVNKYISLQAGIKNLFDVTNINSTVPGNAHNAGGPLPVSYGRSYFLGLNFQWNKK